MDFIMDKRSQVFQLFGPKLLEGFLNLILGEVNELRSDLGLAPRTKEQVYNQIMNDAQHLPDYEWMVENDT